MNFKKNTSQGRALLLGGILALLIPWIPTTYGETEDVKVVERKPDPTNPLFEIAEVEGGLRFRVPKDMAFVRIAGVVGPISSDEYCARKIEAMKEEIKVLSDRVDQLEKNAQDTSGNKDQESL